MIGMKSQIRQLREELSCPRITQEEMARAAGVTVQWYRQVENQGANTSYTTAQALLRAINTERTKRELSALVLEQLELRIV